MSLAVDVISDVICPWCYVGKRQLEKATAAVDGPVKVRWRPLPTQPDDACPWSCPLRPLALRRRGVRVARRGVGVPAGQRDVAGPSMRNQAGLPCVPVVCLRSGEGYDARWPPVAWR